MVLPNTRGHTTMIRGGRCASGAHPIILAARTSPAAPTERAGGVLLPGGLPEPRGWAEEIRAGATA